MKNRFVRQMITIGCVLALTLSVVACGNGANNTSTETQSGTDTQVESGTDEVASSVATESQSQTDTQGTVTTETESVTETVTESTTESTTETTTEVTTETESVTETESESEKEPEKEPDKKPSNSESDKKPSNSESDKKPSNSESDKKPADSESDKKPSNTESDKKPADSESDKKPANTESDKKPANSESDKNTESDKKPSNTESEKEPESESESESEEEIDPNAEGATAQNPILAMFDENLCVQTVDIPAGKSMHYAVYRIGGMVLKIKDADAYVVYNGKKYSAKNGVVEVEIKSALASESVALEIGNKGSKKQSFKMQFSNKEGSYMNPIKLSKVGSEKTFESKANNSDGCYYKYTAQKNGTIVFYVTEVEAKTAGTTGGITVTNNSNSVQVTTAGATAGEDGYIKIEIEVEKGDELLIHVCVNPTATGRFPAADISWIAKYK